MSNTQYKNNTRANQHRKSGERRPPGRKQAQHTSQRANPPPVRHPPGYVKRPITQSPARTITLTDLEGITKNSAVSTFRAAGGDTANQKELRYETISFTDWEVSKDAAIAPYLAYNTARSQHFMTDTHTDTNKLTRADYVDVYALPLASNDNTANTTFTVLSGVQVFNGSDPKRISLANTRTTTVNPTFNIGWRKVFHCNFRKLFSDAVITSVGGDFMQTFVMTIIDPDNGGTLLDTKVQLKIVCGFSEVVSPSTSIKAAERYVSSWTYNQLIEDFDDDYAQIKLRGLSNRT